MLMFRLIWIASFHTRDFLRRYMPTNIVLDRLRTRRVLKWGRACDDVAGHPVPCGREHPDDSHRPRCAGMVPPAGVAVHLERVQVLGHGAGEPDAVGAMPHC